MKSHKDDLVLDAIENASRAPFPGRQRGRAYIDEYVMRRFMNKSEIVAERNESRTFAGKFKGPQDVADVMAHVGIGCHLDSGECQCVGEEVCIRCCTQKDLLGIPPAIVGMIQIKNQRPGVIGGRSLGQVFDIFMPITVAEALGFVE